MKKIVSVIDKDGKVAIRADGVLLDGDIVHVPTMLVDAKHGPAAVYIKDNAPVLPATLASAAKILGVGYNEAAIANLTDAAARHAVVRQRLGTVAEGRPAPFLDAAWGALAGTGSPALATQASVAMPELTDAQKAFAASAVKQAMAYRAGPAGLRDNTRATVDGAKAARNHLMCDAWKSDQQRENEALLDGLSYTERMAVTSGAPPSYVKASERSVSDAVFFDRQRQYQSRQGRSV